MNKNMDPTISDQKIEKTEKKKGLSAKRRIFGVLLLVSILVGTWCMGELAKLIVKVGIPALRDPEIYPLFSGRIEGHLLAMILSLFVLLVSLAALTILAGRQENTREIALNEYDRFPTEVGGAGILIMTWLGMVLFMAAAEILCDWDEGTVKDLLFGCCLAGIDGLAILILWLGWLGFVKRIKAHTLWKNSLCGMAVSACTRLLTGFLQWAWKALKQILEMIRKTQEKGWKVFAAFLLYVFGNLFCFSQIADGNGELFFLIVFLLLNLLVLYYLLYKAGERREVLKGVNRIAGGDISYQLPTERLTGDSYLTANAINSIQDGLQRAVEESVKNERMRTELITNVSHDIKTPLTSIINYVDLLKQENLENPKAAEYLEILEKKSARLKTLTDDLVEASKVSSGAIALKQEAIDLVELVNQTNGEFIDRFAACDLKLICTVPETPIYIRADGRYVWRVLENLYRNVEKYAMAGTRVYVEVAPKGNRGTFVIKNISAVELSLKGEELTERFTRGDASRSTEGSGLGLAIARDLTRLMGGTFQIYVDGDLFRVTISFLME